MSPAEPAGRPRLRIRAIGSPDDPAFNAAYAVLRRAFPPEELLPRDDWVHLLREREQRLWTDTDWHLLVAQRGDTVVGAATGSYVGSLNVGMVGYIAVAASARGQAVGPALRRSLRGSFERDARRIRGQPLEAIVGEVHSDNPWLRHLVQREGAIALDFNYYQPSLHDDHTPVPMVLYYQPLRRRRSSLSAAEVRRLLYALWRRPYRIARPLSRRPFQRMLTELEGRRRIGPRRPEAKPRSKQSRKRGKS